MLLQRQLGMATTDSERASVQHVCLLFLLLLLAAVMVAVRRL